MQFPTTRMRRLRKNAKGYIHGHSAGGTNPSLLEALSITDVNILYDAPYNKVEDSQKHLKKVRLNDMSSFLQEPLQYKSKHLFENQKVKPSDPVYKRINSEDWNIIISIKVNAFFFINIASPYYKNYIVNSLFLQ